MDMSNDQRTRWLAIAPYFDEILDLAEPERTLRLADLDTRAPQIAAAVRALLADSMTVDQHPLLADGSIAGPMEGDLAGKTLGAYTIDSVVGYGGMGTVWLAHRSDGRFEGAVAVKLLNAALVGRPSEHRFSREGSVLATLKHGHIAQLIDAGVAPGGQPYLVIEYVDGERIDRYCELHGLDIPARVKLFLDVLAAVSHAHSHLIVHRDLKPSNILVTLDGSVKLLDFGVAALLDGRDRDLTHEASAGFTPEYAAPEQLRRQNVTTATDVYALGLVLFVLLAGRHPRTEDDPTDREHLLTTLERTPTRPSQLTSDPKLGRSLRGDLDNIVAKALRIEPEQRYTTADAFARDLERFLAHEPITARPPSLTYTATKFVRRHRGGVATTAAMVLLLVGATVVTTTQMLEAQRQRDIASYQSKRAEFQAEFAYHLFTAVGEESQPISIRHLLKKGIEVLDTNYGDDPEFAIGMLVNMSGRYMDLGDTEAEYAALVRAESIARRIADPALIAFVQCNTVETEVALGRPERAAERLSEGLASLAMIPGGDRDRWVECATAEARLHWASGDLASAIEVATRVAHDMDRAGESNDLHYQSVTSMLEIILAEAGRSRDAIQWNRRRIEVLERIGTGGTLTMALARHGQTVLMFDAGELKSALEHQRAIVEGIAAQEGVDYVPPQVANAFGGLLVRVEETPAGLIWLDRALTAARIGNNRRALMSAFTNRARAHLDLGNRTAAASDLKDAAAVGAQHPSEHAVGLQRVRLLRAQINVLDADLAAAIAELNRLRLELDGRPGPLLVATLLLESDAHLSLNDATGAASAARAALAVAEAIAIRSDQSADVGLALAALASAQLAMGDTKAAHASWVRAQVALTNGLGPTHSMTRAVHTRIVMTSGIQESGPAPVD